MLGVLGVGGPMPHQAKSGHMRLFYRHEGGTLGIADLRRPVQRFDCRKIARDFEIGHVLVELQAADLRPGLE